MNPVSKVFTALTLSAVLSPAFAQPQPALVALLSKNTCTACHAIDKKVVGPAFKDVAAKYRTDKEAQAKLVTKIKAGGSGVWGAIPMPPQNAKDEDIRLIVKQLLELQ
jgi:cytochrome c